jgi:hypothetical protein
VRIETAGIVGNPPSTRDSRRCIWLLIWICPSGWCGSVRPGGTHGFVEARANGQMGGTAESAAAGA